MSNKFLFIHNKKAAGTSIIRTLTPHKKKQGIILPKRTRPHPRMDWITDNYDLDSLFVFCVVRNPWDRVVSYFHQNKRQNSAISTKKFETFVRNPRMYKALRTCWYVAQH